VLYTNKSHRLVECSLSWKMYIIDADRGGWTALCSYSNKIREVPNTSTENYGNTSIDGMILFFTANFTRTSKMRGTYIHTCYLIK